MSAQDRAIQKLARDLASMKKEVHSWRGPQADYTSIENGGNFTFKDGDGNVTAVVGGQDDGSNTIRHVDGPIPAVPSGLSAHVDGPIIQAAWDGTFETETTYDWAFLEVEATGPSGELVRATINDATGGSVAFTATASGEWTVVARSVSRAEKRSLDGDAGTVEVKITDLSGAIEAVQDSANGKNKVTYSSHAPTEADPGIFDDTWFVGQVGRPNDVIEATNLAKNPTFVDLKTLDGAGQMGIAGGAALSVDPAWSSSGSGSLRVSGTGSLGSGAYVLNQTSAPSAADAGKTFTMSCDVRLSAPLSSPGANAGTVIVGYRNTSGAVGSFAIATSNKAPNVAGVHRVSVTVTLPADFGGWLVRCSADVASGSVWFDSFMWREGSVDSPYFDGDTPSGESDNESHYRWTGTPHASTSEKYLPALSIGDSDKWNVIEQYRHNGTGWERVELSHMVFSSVDLGKATVGELDGIRIMGQTIRGEQLSGDAIDGKVITGATVQSAASGARAVMSASGFEAFDATDARTFFADATTGDVNMTGSFYSNYDGLPRVEINNDDWADIQVVGEDGVPRFVNGSGIRLGSTAMDGVSIFHGSWNTSGGASGQAATFEGPLGKSRLHLLDSGRLEIQSGPAAGTVNSRIGTFANGSAYVVSYKEGGSQSSRLSVDAFGRGTFSAYGGTNGVVPMGRLAVDETLGAELTSQTTAGTFGARVRAGIDGSVEIRGSAPVDITSQGVQVFTTQTSGSDTLVVMPTVGSITGSGSNYVVASSGGGLRRIGSSARYKNDIRPVQEDYADRLLSLTYKSWVDKGEAERYEQYLSWRDTTPIGPPPREFFESMDEPVRYGGLIAEDVDAADLPLLVDYDEYGRPNSVNYDRVGPALIHIVRELRDRVTELETKLENS